MNTSPSKKENYISVPGAKGVIALGIDYKIRDVKHQQGFQKRLDEVIKEVWEYYCGADPAMLTDEFTDEASSIITMKFSMLGVNEIKEAFRLSSVNVISSDLRSFGGRISIQVIGKTLDAYIEYRKPIAAEIMREQAVKNDIESQKRSAEVKEQYEKSVLAFWNSKEKPSSWTDCKSYYLDTLIEMGLVELNHELKRECVTKAETIRKQEVEVQKHNSETIEQIREANKMLNSFAKSEKAIVINYAKSLYLFHLKTV